MIYFLKLSNVHGFWSNLQRTDIDTHLAAKSYQKILRKFIKAKHDVKFLNDCKKFDVYPKFVRWKNIKTKDPRERSNYYSKNLKSATDKRRRELRNLTEKHDIAYQALKDLTTSVKGNLIIYSITRQYNKICEKTKRRHQKKLDNLIINKRITDGINKNPNKTITNLSDVELTNEEILLLKLWLKHGLLIRPKESEMTTIMEDIFDQIVRQNVMKDNNISKHCIQTALKSSTYAYLDLDFKNFGIDQK